VIASSADNGYVRDMVMKYADMVTRIAFQNTGNQADAEDAAQEVFLKLMRQPVFADETHAKAWLIRVTVNQCRDLKKSFWHRRTEPLSGTLSVPEDEPRDVLAEVRKLPANYRDAIYLYYYEGYTVPEIAELLGRKENTVGSWLTRARKRLKDILTEGDGG
jgi:RNA polymerase sigma-70 factor (ECF subfamily)